MKNEVGLWIDHTKAVIFSLADAGAGTKGSITKNCCEM